MNGPHKRKAVRNRTRRVAIEPYRPYRVAEIETDALRRGWTKAELIRQAQAVATAEGAPRSRMSFVYFLLGRSHSPSVARLLAAALGKDLADYTNPVPSRATRGVAA